MTSIGEIRAPRHGARVGHEVHAATATIATAADHAPDPPQRGTDPGSARAGTVNGRSRRTARAPAQPWSSPPLPYRRYTM